MKETLESLRHYRNRYVHAGNAGHESEEITYRIKSFVDPHIVRLVNNTFQVKNLQEYGKLLGYPTDIKTLEKMRTWSIRALRAAREDEGEEAAGCSAYTISRRVTGRTIPGMTDRERQLLGIRYIEAHAELQALAEGRVLDGDPAEHELELLGKPITEATDGQGTIKTSMAAMDRSRHAVAVHSDCCRVDLQSSS